MWHKIVKRRIYILALFALITEAHPNARGGQKEKNVNIINLTPHHLHIHTEDDIVEVPPSGSVCRVHFTYIDGGSVTGIPVTLRKPPDVDGLPEEKGDHIYVVSGKVERHVKRHDVYSPGKMIRDDEGSVVGCEGLLQT